MQGMPSDESENASEAVRVSCFPADRGGCGFYRLLAASGILQQRGYDLAVDSPKLHAKYIEDDVVGMAPIGTLDGWTPDIIVLQRPLKKVLSQAIPYIQEQGIKVVVELDDDFTSIDPANPAFVSSHPKHSPDSNFHHLNKAIRAADMLTVSTEQLARRYNHPNTVVLPNLIPEAYLELGRKKLEHDPLIVGWGGSPLTHPNDLQQMGQLELNGAWFMAVGGRTTLERLNIPASRGIYVPWTKSIEDYAHVLTQLDIGLAPLADTIFNRSKSRLKALEYSALGVPFVASALPEYENLGAGLIARKPKDWKRLIRQLLLDKDLRQSVREKGLEIASEHTYDQHSGRWWDAWGSLLGSDRRETPSPQAAQV